MKTQKIAAIDIGSNSIKLAIAEAAADSFAVVWQERERVRLGLETLEKRFLSSEAVRRAIQAIARFKSTVDSRRAEAVLAVATASVREAENAAGFIEEVYAATGVRVEVLSEIEEARLIGLAAAANFKLKTGLLLNVDIGGGSTELSLMRPGGAPERLFSMKIGAVGLTRKFLSSDPPVEKEVADLRQEIARRLARPVSELGVAGWQIASGTSGTILNFAAILNARANGAGSIEFPQIVGLNAKLAQLSSAERARMFGLSRQRAEVIVAGGEILENVMRALEIQTLLPCAYALREGVIIDYLRRSGFPPASHSS